MSPSLINRYLAELDRIKKVSGSTRESVVREAFKDLLKAWGRQQALQFVPESELETATRERRYVDGALLHELRVPFGYWEAKDEADDLDAEITLKFRRGDRVAGHKARVIDLLARVTTVSVETVRIVEMMKGAVR